MCGVVHADNLCVGIVKPTTTRPVRVSTSTAVLKSKTILQTVVSQSSTTNLQPTILATPVTEQPTLVREGMLCSSF